MDIRELRIGNYIEFKNEVFKIFSIDATAKLCESIPISFISINDGISSDCLLLDNSKIEAIPLTKDWLLKFGFNKKVINAFGLSLNEYNRLYVSINKNFYEVNFHTWENDVTIAKIQYVHQLQNLYFALTGGELILKD